MKKIIFLHPLTHKRKESDPDPELDLDSSVRGTDPRIRIRTKMSQIPNTVRNAPRPKTIYAGLPPDVSLRLITQGVLVDLSIAELVDVVVTLVLPELHLQHVASLCLRRGK